MLPSSGARAGCILAVSALSPRLVAPHRLRNPPAALVESLMHQMPPPIRNRPLHGQARRVLLSSTLAALLSGCAVLPGDPLLETERPAESARHARILVAEREPARVVAAVIQLRTGGEWTLRSADARAVVRSRRLDNLLTAARFGNAFGRRIDQRTVYSVAPTADGVEIIASSRLVRFPGTAFEHALDDPTVDTAELSRDLRSLKAHLDAAGAGRDAPLAQRPRH